MVSNYSGGTYQVLHLVEGMASPYLYFCNLVADNEVHNWEENLELFEKAKEIIYKTMEKDTILSDTSIGKFAIVFPFGFVFYCFGIKGEIDSICVRYKEFEFTQDGCKEIAQVIPCPLEDKIKSIETSFWFESKLIRNYYSLPRTRVAVENKYPDKKV